METDQVQPEEIDIDELEKSADDEGQEPEEEIVDTPTYIDQLLKIAKSAAPRLASLTAAVKNEALLAMAEGLENASEELMEANEKDLEAFDSSDGREAMADRLRLTPERIEEMASGIREIAALRDPVGESLGMHVRPNGMKVGRVRVPIGVIGMIYESRPNVTADAAALCLKSGNVCVLRGGSEAIHSNTAIATILSEAAKKSGIPDGAISFVERPERDAVLELLKRDDCIDVIIPRGGEALMKTVSENTNIPVIKHDKGVCHIYVDGNADVDMAQKIALNAKVQRPSTCNAMETLLVHQQTARTLLPQLGKALVEAKVEVRGCEKTCGYIPEAIPATDEDYGQEFLSLTLAVKVVKDIDHAMEHIRKHGSQHTEVIVTNDYGRAVRFMREVDAGAVMVNASSRLNDGKEFGLGAEIGISTTRIHARGPMGLEDLTCSKYIVFGSGQIRE
ncbi:MAG: glutamate-5-semialdehyde dehydrogenase [Nitrospirae bacterium]|nr:glutamate-5-semialdehyde dehydrogenase [Nitrospirota bacterium]MDA1304498.1 glutamate-5-semialdehyde dehydrogenase [Nitrospirota bacterium]